jgi:hypothetical protein
MTSKGDGFGGDPLLEAAVTSESKNVLVKESMLRSVVFGGCHLSRKRIANSIGDSLAERTGRGLNTVSFIEFRVPWCLTVELAEVLHLIERKIVAGKVKPTIKEHRSMARGEYEAVAIEPFGGFRIVAKRVPVENGPDIGGT